MYQYRRHNIQHKDTQHNDTQHNDIQHKGLICEIQHVIKETQHNKSANLLNVFMLSVAIYLLMCWVSSC